MIQPRPESAAEVQLPPVTDNLAMNVAALRQTHIHIHVISTEITRREQLLLDASDEDRQKELRADIDKLAQMHALWTNHLLELKKVMPQRTTLEQVALSLYDVARDKREG